jgi:putative spermidine/putrescine transport system substrate-binding protein
MSATRSTTLTALAVAATTALTPAAMAQDKPFDGVTLRIGTWGGPWKESQERLIASKFADLGGTVEFVTGSPQANMSKLFAARGQTPPIDMIEMLDATLPIMVANDLLEPIDLESVSNKAALQDFQYDDTKVASWATQEGICYDVGAYAELGLEAPTTYGDLAAPELDARVIIPDINSGGGLANFSAMAIAAGGDTENVAPALEMIAGMGPIQFWSRGGQAVAGFETGDILASVTHAGWCVRAHRAGADVAFVHPTIDEDTVGVSKDGWLGIVKGTPNYEAAVWYVNEFLDPTFQSDFAVKSGVVPVNGNSLATVGEDPLLAEMFELDPETIGQQLRIDYSTVDIGEWTDQWSRSVTQ